MIRPASYVFCALALLRPPVPVVLVRLSPPTLNVVVAETIRTPGELELICTVQLPAVVIQVLIPPTKTAPMEFCTKLNVTSVPFGAGVHPEPSFCCTVAVNVCGSLIGLVSTSGLIAI